MIFGKKNLEFQPDHQLMRQIARGSTAAFDLLIRRYQQAMVNLVYRFLGDAAEAEDIAQEAFIRLYLAAERYRPEAPFKVYLFKIARNLCLDHLRKKKPILMGTGMFDIRFTLPMP